MDFVHQSSEAEAETDDVDAWPQAPSASSTTSTSHIANSTRLTILRCPDFSHFTDPHRAYHSLLSIIMALNPRFAGQRFVAATNAKTLHTLELCKIVTNNEFA